MFDLGGGELLLILVGILVLFGPKKLPELAQNLGKGLRQFRKAQQEFNDQITNAMREEEQSARQKNARPIDSNTIHRSSPGTLGAGSTSNQAATTPVDPSAIVPAEVSAEKGDGSDDHRNGTSAADSEKSVAAPQPSASAPAAETASTESSIPTGVKKEEQENRQTGE